MAIWSILRTLCIINGRLVYFMAIWSILRTLCIINGRLVYLLVIWYIFPSFCKYYREKSGNPGAMLGYFDHETPIMYIGTYIHMFV
jgi:hypothetical protein